MDEVAIKNYLTRLGCRKIRSTRNQVNSTCPFELNHKSGKDSRPGFTVKVSSGGKSPYYCPSCHETDSLEWLVYQRFGEVEGLKKARGRDEFLNAQHWGRKTVETENEFIDEDLLSPFSGSVPKYALDRGLTIETCKAWGLGHDKQFKRLMFSIRDRKARLVGVCGRAVYNHPVKYANYSVDTKKNRLVPFIDSSREEDFVPFRKSRRLYGAHMLTHGTDIVLVEGQMDVVKVWQNGYDGLAIMGSWISNEQIARLVTLCPKDRVVIALLDNDEAGREGLERLKNGLKGKVSLKVATCPDGKDPGDLEQDELEARPSLQHCPDPAASTLVSVWLPYYKPIFVST